MALLSSATVMRERAAGGETASVVGTAPSAEGWKGGDIQLPCNLQQEPFAVYWIKENRSDPDQLTYKAIFYNGDFRIIEERFNIITNFSLVITELEVADEGHYRCQVVLESFEDYSNSTLLTVNSMATEHVIEQCVRKVHGSNPCTIQASREAQTFHLDCRLSGFKPNVSLVWSTSGRTLPSVRSIQYTLPDGTFERLETIAVTATQDTDQNITCTASGVSVERATSKFITVLSVNDQKDVPGLTKIALGIGLTVFFVVLITVLFFGIGKLLQTYRPELLPDGFKRIPCWKKPGKHKGVPLLRHKVKERKKLRAKIRGYKPGSASGYDLSTLERVNINLFGLMSAGKSAFINSIFFAFKGGRYDIKTCEGIADSVGGQTTHRSQHPLTNHIDLHDNRGMRDFDIAELDRIKDEIKGCRSKDTKTKIKKVKSQECHAAVYVYDCTNIACNEAEFLTFIHKFVKEVKSIHVMPPQIVITHADECNAPKATVVETLEQFEIPDKNVLLLENYTEKNHEEDVDKDIKMLQFLWTTLGYCDQNAYNLKDSDKESIAESSWCTVI
ncbi:uncharacterized protein [Diadema setosum]|uniref:uncharacterized protein n=1 Tax=Diadema setosum TaxID=31175 RepID=UPI003B3B6939